MLLTRSWSRMNKYRLTKHHVVFFIFIVSNVGGSLTPVGDPPLFLHYLKGVPCFKLILLLNRSTAATCGLRGLSICSSKISTSEDAARAFEEPKAETIG
jgi:Na+/H+ antiporter NhaD/arsenite permease-like protein